MGEVLYFGIYVMQQLGVMLGVGAQTVLLCTHLVALHRGDADNLQASYVRAALFALACGLVFMLVSGGAAVALHIEERNMAVLLAPAFLFKWALIVVLLGAYFVQRQLRAWSTTYYTFTGATWYALFLVHSLAPVTSWTTLGVLYALWLAFFVAVWMLFVAIMRRKAPVVPLNQQ